MSLWTAGQNDAVYIKKHRQVDKDDDHVKIRKLCSSKSYAIKSLQTSLCRSNAVSA